MIAFKRGAMAVSPSLHVEVVYTLISINPALHFKLGVATNTDDNYEETEFQYTPRLDNDRDRDLLELLPDYLREEITFSRHNAARFYGRVVETLTKKRTGDDGA